MNTPSTSVSPGLGGFLAFFLLAIALWLLMRNMNARIRRMSYKAEQRDDERRAAAGDDVATGEGDAPVDPASDGLARDDPPRTPESDEEAGQEPSGR